MASRQVVFGSYELLERIGQGGMAEVWRARARGMAGFQKTVVIKRVLPSLLEHADFAELLVREARIAALLNHPNVVQIFELGEEDGVYYIAMEYVNGCNLAVAMAYESDPMALRGIPLELRIWIVAEAARALDYAHRARDDAGRPLHIVHRDISPQNILLGYEGQVKVGDFGIALADARGLGREEDPTLVRGKYAYMSPEQARGETLDRRSDLFSLGIVLHELLTGQRLFRSDHQGSTIENVLTLPIPAVDVRRLGVPGELDGIVRRCLERDRELRYSWASDLAEDLDRVLRDLGSRAGPAEIAARVKEIAPPSDQRANKLSSDLAGRLAADARRVETGGVAASDVSELTAAAHPRSVSHRSERRLAVLLVARAKECEADAFRDLVATAGGYALSEVGGYREALFGLDGGDLAAAPTAVRVAMELRHAGARTVSVSEAEVRVLATTNTSKAVDPEQASRERAIERFLALAKATDAGALGVSEALAEELAWEFRLEDSPVEGLRCVAGIRQGARRSLEAIRSRTFLGRRHELRALREAFIEATSGRGAPQFLIGPAGMGKTRLVAELAGLVSAAEGQVVYCRAKNPGQPLSLLAELFDELVGDDRSRPLSARVDRLRLLGLDERQRAQVYELLAGVQHGSSPPIDAAKLSGMIHGRPIWRPGRPRGLDVLTSVGRAVRHLAMDAPLLLVFEDLQRADEASRQLLPLLLRTLRDEPVMVVFTGRSEVAFPHVPGVLREIPALPPELSGRLFAVSVGARAVEAQVRRDVMTLSGGNPSAIEALARSVATDELSVDQGVVHGFDPKPDLPERLRPIAASTMGEVPAHAQGVLRHLAFFPDGADLATLEALGPINGVPIDASLRLLLSRRAIDGEAESWRRAPARWGQARVTPPLPSRIRICGGRVLADAIQAALDPGERRRIHGHIAHVLESAGALEDERVEELARHAIGAGDTARGPIYLARAAELRQAAGDLGGAASQLRHASALRGAHTVEGADLAVRAAELALEAGDVATAQEVLGSTPAAFEDQELTLRVALCRARLLALSEDWLAILELAEMLGPRVAEGSEGGSIAGHLRLLEGRAELELGRLQEALESFRFAVEQLENADRPAIAAAGLAGLAIVYGRAGELEAAEAALHEVLVAAVSHAEPELRYLAIEATAEVASARDDHETALQRWDAATTLAREVGLEEEHARACVRAALSAVAEHEEGHAAVRAGEALTLARDRNLPAVVALAQAVQSLIAIATEGDTHYVRAIVRSVDHLDELGRPGDAAEVLGLLAEAHVAIGDVGAAIRTLGRAQPFARQGGRLALEGRLAHRAEQLAAGEV